MTQSKIDPAHTGLDTVEYFSFEAESRSDRLIDKLQLSSTARAAAEILNSQFPGNIYFTSGRRSIEKQARAMAPNVVANRQWIEQTYKNTPQRHALQEWVDNNPQANTTESIAVGLKSVMYGWTEEEKTGFSRHITGNAFDIKPVAGELGERIKEAIGELPNIQWYTFSEGGLELWHAQFHSGEPNYA